jgi:hypothetical protein
MSEIVPLSAAADADVTDELQKGGLAFGELIKATGQSVAKTQRELEKTAADSISALCTQNVEIIAAELVEYNDQGAITDVQTVKQQLPLITIVDPPVYQWENVRLQAMLFAREVASETSTTTTSAAVSSSFSASKGLLFGSARASFQAAAGSTTVTTSETSDVSIGVMRLNALLTPRKDTGIPKPRQIVEGPSLRIVRGPLDAVSAPDADGVRTRAQHLTIEYRNAEGDPIAGKKLSVSTDGVSWAFDDGVDAETDADGEVALTLTRLIPDGADPNTPVDVVVSVRIGLVQDTLAVTM